MNNETKLSKFPLWKDVAEHLVADGLYYGQTWTVEFFEKGLKCNRDTREFAFAMIALRTFIEVEEGYYIQSSECGTLYSIPQAPQHEEVASRFDRSVRRYAVRSINLRSAVLSNPKAELTDSERSTMERNLEHSATRLVLISRANSIAKFVKEHSPKLLERK